MNKLKIEETRERVDGFELIVNEQHSFERWNNKDYPSLELALLAAYKKRRWGGMAVTQAQLLRDWKKV